jgi:hypothetical protein
MIDMQLRTFSILYVPVIVSDLFHIYPCPILTLLLYSGIHYHIVLFQAQYVRKIAEPDYLTKVYIYSIRTIFPILKILVLLYLSIIIKDEARPS